MANEKRRDVVGSLLRLDRPLREIARELDQFPFDCAKGDAVMLTRSQAVAVLARFVNGALRAGDLMEWAQVIQGRDDVDFEDLYREILLQLIFTLAHPEISEDFTEDSARRWMRKLTSTSY